MNMGLGLAKTASDSGIINYNCKGYTQCNGGWSTALLERIVHISTFEVLLEEVADRVTSLNGQYLFNWQLLHSTDPAEVIPLRAAGVPNNSTLMKTTPQCLTEHIHPYV